MIRNVLIFLSATNLYVYLKLRLGFGRGWWSFLYITWSVIWAVLPIVSRRGRVIASRSGEILFSFGFTWAAIVGIACMGFLFMDVCSLAAWLIDRLAGKSLAPKFFTPRKCVPVTLFIIIMTVFYSFCEAWNVRRVDLTIETSKLPEGVASLRIAQVTDVHLGGLYTAGRLKKVMDIVRAAEPDIFVVTGDLVDGDTSFRDEELKLLTSHGAKYGAYAVTGNHDFYAGIAQAVEFMRRAGLVLLRNAQADAAGITIIGLDDGQFRGGMPSGLSFPENRFVLLLKHRPQVIEGSVGKFDLQLSGHTHGGQIWPFGHAAQWVNGHTQHLSYKGTSAVYVSNGAGFWGPPMRLFTPPEVTIINIIRAEP